jgi:hypothetical protein
MYRAIRRGIGYRGIQDEKKALEVNSALVGAANRLDKNHPTESTSKASNQFTISIEPTKALTTFAILLH